MVLLGFLAGSFSAPPQIAWHILDRGMMKAQTPRELFLSGLAQARKLTPEQRVIAGFRQSELAISIVKDGIRHQHPDAHEDTLSRLLIERVELMRQLERRRVNTP